MRSIARAALLVSLASIGCGGISEEVDSTVATVTPVRGETRLGEGAAPEVARATIEDAVSTGERALARLSLDLGPALLVDAETELRVVDAGAVELRRGRVFAETRPGEQLELRTERGQLRSSDASLSASLSGDGLRVYVVRGEVSWTAGQERGVASAGEELTLSGTSAARTAATLWHDWTGGLARPGPADASGPEGVGMLEARVPDELGMARWPLVIRRLDVRVRVESDLAITEVDQLFFNPASETVEGLYRIRVPEEAVLQRFAVDRDDRLVDGYVRERAQAQRAYEQQVYRGSTEDPALLEWDAPGSYRARIYPIQPGETRRIVIRYVEWLRPPAAGAPRMYRYPMGGGARAPHVQELSISADVSEAGAERVRAGMGAQVEEGAVRIRRSDFRPRADFWMELVGGEGETQRAWTAEHEPPPRAPDAAAVPNEADERDYFFLPLILPASLAPADRGEGLDLVIVADVSAGTDRSHLELGRSVAESLAAHLDERDRVAIVSSDLRIRSVDGERPALVEASPENIERLLDGLARTPAGGATDLGQAIAGAAALLDPARPSAIVYVGDGAPTVGELRAEGLLERMARLPSPVRLYAVAIGSDANLELLEVLTRGGGMALRVEERAQAADAAMRVLAHTERAVAHSVEVALGDGIENAFPRRPMDAVLGQVFPVVGRVRGELPSSVTVKGTIGGQEFEQTIAIEVGETDESTDLRLRWASERLRQLMLDGAGREEVAELGTRYGLITPFTSYYVPSRNELARMGGYASLLIDRPLLPIGTGTSTGDQIMQGVLALALGPLSISGCALGGESDAPVAASGPVAPPPVEPQQLAPESEAEEADNEGGNGRRALERSAGAAAAPQPSPAEPMPADYPDDGIATAEARRERAAPAPGAFDTTTGAWNSPTSPYGADTAAGEDPMAATGALMGDEIGDNFGFGGLGLRGTGRGGGGTGEGTIGLGQLGAIGGGEGTGSGYGRGASTRGRDAVVPQVRAGDADVRGSLSRDVIRRVIRRHINEVRFCYEQSLGANPGLEGRVTASFLISPTGAVQSAAISNSTLNNATAEQCIASAVRRWTFPPPSGGGVVGVNYPFVLTSGGGGGGAPSPAIVTRIVHTTNDAAHRARRCSDAADLTLDDRRALWRERLSSQGSASAWIGAYDEAIRQCEAPTWRDRRAFLSLILERAGSIEAMLAVYRLLDAPASRGFVRAQVLRRVRSPEDLRQVRGAFGLGAEVDWTLVEQILARATTEGARIRALRRLSWQYADSFELKLRLLAALERASRNAEAKRMADRMRADPLADPGVRTAIGEMFLRMGREDEARRTFSEIVEFAPLDELARRRLGDLYRAHGWFHDAYRQYQTLREIRPDDASVLLLLAQAAADAGRTDEALRLERGLMQTSQPGDSVGIARTALLWSSVRFARLRKAAEGDEARKTALTRRMRASGVLREAGQLRVTLVWSHPDAQLALWGGLPGLSATRPSDITPEYGLEAFDLEEQEAGTYTFEVRRSADENAELTPVTAQLVVIWNEGQEDEQIELVELSFDRERTTYAWTLSGRTLRARE